MTENLVQHYKITRNYNWIIRHLSNLKYTKKNRRSHEILNLFNLPQSISSYTFFFIAPKPRNNLQMIDFLYLDSCFLSQRWSYRSQNQVETSVQSDFHNAVELDMETTPFCQLFIPCSRLRLAMLCQTVFWGCQKRCCGRNASTSRCMPSFWG